SRDMSVRHSYDHIFLECLSQRAVLRKSLGNKPHDHGHAGISVFIDTFIVSYNRVIGSQFIWSWVPWAGPRQRKRRYTRVPSITASGISIVLSFRGSIASRRSDARPHPAPGFSRSRAP